MKTARSVLFPSLRGGGVRGEGLCVLSRLGSYAHSLTPTLSPRERGPKGGRSL